MATYRTRISTSWRPEQAFAYMADFSNAARWDPGVVEAEKVSDGPVGLGTTFSLRVVVGRRLARFDYEVVQFEPPSAVTLRAETRMLRSTDSIVVMAAGEGSVVRYNALLQGKGALRLAEPLLARTFQRIGDGAAEGLRAVLSPEDAKG